MTPETERRDMKDAPRDGTLIIVGDPDCGEFPMRWGAIQKNGWFPGDVGFWITPGADFTWNEREGFGPSYWVPITTTV